MTANPFVIVLKNEELKCAFRINQNPHLIPRAASNAISLNASFNELRFIATLLLASTK